MRSGAAVLGFTAALFLAACGGGGSGSSAPGGQGASTPVTHGRISITNFMFQPMSITVAPGTTVSVHNADGVAHTLTASNGALDTGSIGPDQTKTFTAPTKAGTYSYICSIHQYMRGTVTVS